MIYTILCRQNMFLLFNEICIHEEMLHTHTHHQSIAMYSLGNLF